MGKSKKSESIIINYSVDPKDWEEDISNGTCCDPKLSSEPSVADLVSYRDSTFNIVSRVAYLIGVSKKVFANESLPPSMDVYNELDANKQARIIRHLCIVRTNIWRAYGQICAKIKYEHRDIRLMTEHIPAESLEQLRLDGVDFVKKKSTKLFHHIIEINRIISDRINNCKDIFPLWLNWEYIKKLIVMPDGLTESGTKAAVEKYYAHKDWYPYKMYINWTPADEGDILRNDKKFVTLLYQWNKDEFKEYSRVTDATDFVKGNIYDYIRDSSKTVIMVDCENADPYRLSAAFKGLDKNTMSKVSSIILIDDVHTTTAWQIFEHHVGIPVRRLLIERVKDDKSLVDICLTAEACKEHYKNNVDSFVIVSSDSDFWGLISSLSDARFLVMVEREKVGADIKNALVNNGIFYCYLDSFYSGDASELQQSAIFMSMYKYIENKIHLNIFDMFEEALRESRAPMNEAEKERFIKKYLRTMQLGITEEGDVELFFKHKKEN